MLDLSPYNLLSPKQRVRQWYRATRAKWGRCAKPDFLLIGAQKSGTSALHSTLKCHPQLVGARFKELHFFSNDSWSSPRNLHQYHGFFPAKPMKQVQYFESTPTYLYHPEVAERLHQYNPDLKLVVMLRDPAERAFSAWKMHHYTFRNGPFSFLVDKRNFTDAIEAELQGDLNAFSSSKDHHSYVKWGLYAKQIARFFKYFTREQILIIDSAKTRTDPNSQIQRTLSFLSVPQQALEMQVSNTGVRLPEDQEPVISMLREFYGPYNEQLFEILGESYAW